MYGYFDTNKWKNAISGGIRSTLTTRTVLELAYQHAVNTPAVGSYNHVFLALCHRFTNGHALFFKTDYHRCRGSPQPNKFLCLLKYSLPLEFNTGKSREYGEIRGKILHQSTLEPVSYAVVNIAGERVATNSMGAFYYNLPPGNYPLKVECSSLESTQIDEKTVSVKGGKSRSVQVLVNTSSIIEGELLIYELPREFVKCLELLEGINCKGIIEEDLELSGGLKDVTIILIQKSTNIRCIAKTNKDGKFRFINLPKGDWILTIRNEDLPQNFQIDHIEQQVFLRGGEKEHCRFLCFPNEYRAGFKGSSE